MHAAIYTRISSDPTGQQLGVTRQHEDCRALAKQLGWTILETYTDNDTSATTSKPRPEYQRLLQDIRDKKIQAIVTWHADRLYRKITDLVEIVDIAKEHNLQIATVRAGHIDLTTPTGRLVAGLLATVATYEGEAKSDRWRRSITQRRAAGVFTASAGHRLYGYTRQGEIVPAEATHIRKWASEVIAGRSLNSIVRELEARDIRTSSGGYWSHPGLRQLLTNPRLAGHATLRGKIVGTGQWEPILTTEQHDTLVSIFNRTKTGAPKPRVALLPGLIWCGNCDTPLITGSRAQSGTRIRTYRCSRQPGNNACQKISGVAAPIEEYVEQYAQELLADPETRRRLAALPLTPDYSDEVAALDIRINELETQLDQPGVPIEPLVAALSRAVDRRTTLIAEQHPSPVVLPDLPLAWPNELFRRRRLIDLVVDRVDLGPSLGFGMKFDTDRLTITPR